MDASVSAYYSFYYEGDFTFDAASPPLTIAGPISRISVGFILSLLVDTASQIGFPFHHHLTQFRVNYNC